MFEQTVTVYHRIGAANGPEPAERWVRLVLRDVYFVSRTGGRARRDGLAAEGGGSILIPRTGRPEYQPPGGWVGEGWTIAPGDWVIEGDLQYEIERSPSELRALGEPHLVTAVKCLMFGEMAHWKVWCDGNQP